MARVTSNIAANVVGKVWTAALGIALTPVYVRYLGMESYGLVGLFATLQGLLALLDLGLGVTLSREIARVSGDEASDRADQMRDTVRTLELVYGGIGVGAGLAVAGASGAIASGWLHAEQLPPETVSSAVAMMGLILAVQWPSMLYLGGLAGLQQQVRGNAVSMLFGTARAVGALLVVALLSPTIEAFFAWTAAISALGTLVTRLVLLLSIPPGTRRGRFRSALLSSNWRFAAGVSGITISATVLTQLDRILLSKLLSLESFGYYSLAALAASGLSFVVGAVSSACFPRLAQLVGAGDTTELRAFYRRSCQAMAVMTLPAAVVLALFSRELMWAWTGDESTAARTAPVVSVLAAGTALNGVVALPYALQLAHGWTRLALVVNLVAIGVMVPALIVATSRYGPLGAAGCWFGLNVTYVLLHPGLTHRRLLPGATTSWYGLALVAPLAAAAGVAATARVVVGLPGTRLGVVAALSLVGLLTLGAASLATPEVRRWIWARGRRFGSVGPNAP